jgi:ubiquinone/menaquinone biosynthesis C-methylase UbiE
MGAEMTIDAPEPSQSDVWSEWLLRRRNGNDPEEESVIRRKVERFRDRVLEGAGPLAGKVLLDVGAGDGLIAFGAFERAGPSLRAIFADVSRPLLERAEQRAVEYGVRERCTFLNTSAEELDGVANESADVVTTRAVLAYLGDKAAAARQFHRVLKPGGRVSIAEPINRDEAVHMAAFSNFLLSAAAGSVSPLAILQHRCKAALLPSTQEEIQKNPLTNFSERDLINFFQNAGFIEIHMELHIDVMRQAAQPWDTYLDIAPRPGAATLREVFATQLSAAEQHQLEGALRPVVETGMHRTRETMAYLTAVKLERRGAAHLKQRK